MKKLIVTGLIVLGSYYSKAQTYTGFLTDNYSGVISTIANPANIVDSRYKTDINLVAANFGVGNDYYGVNVLDALGDDYDFDLDATKSPSNDNNIILNLDVMGPAFMFNLNKKSSIALFTRARSIININEINGNTIDEVDNDNTNDFMVNEGDFNLFGQAWGEFGLTYARILMNNQQHFLKGGLSLKYLQGAGSGYIQGKNVTIDYDEDGAGVNGASINSTGALSFGRFDNFDNDNYEYDLPEATGFGVDLGFIYEWRPNHQDYTKTNANGDSYTLKHKNKYKLKLGLSITDIGAINYKNGEEDVYDITNSVTEDDFDNADDIEDFLNSFYTLTASNTGYKTKLPTALHLTADWSFTKNLFINLNTDLSLIKKGANNASRIANIASLTPRYESRFFSFYVPLSMIENNGFQAGAGLRLGMLYLGSASVLSVLTSDDTKGADAYIGTKISLKHRKTRDRDEDGVIDKLDACPKVAGPIENNGCPWGDNDDDGILDNEDACPETAGPIDNKGCPWGDQDGDTVLDNVDACIDVAGPAANNGCPFKDTDADGVLDKDDNCIDIAGTVANKGCPEVVEVKKVVPVVTEAVQQSLNAYAKTILFNSGKSSIKTESYTVLNDIVKILGEYPTAKFSIEGHTDSAGSDVLNQKLSESRASAVMAFLISNGVASSRLKSTGFGESNPIANNATAAGRAENRRVEINLVK